MSGLEIINVTDLLRPGVYLLGHSGRVTYVGKARVLLVALAHHALRNRVGLPSWFPVKSFPFDSIEIVPCDPARAIQLAAAYVSLHDPIHNRGPRTASEARTSPGHTLHPYHTSPNHPPATPRRL